MSLSVILITKNEAANLLACLQTVGFADEIIIVDNASSDDTAKIAATAGARFYSTTDWPGFGLQKNRALDYATCDWVFSIDADERVSPILANEIKSIVRLQADHRGATAAYEVPRLTQFCGQWIYHCGWTPDRVLRLFKRDSARFSSDVVHERLVLNDAKTPVHRLKGQLLHWSYPTPAHYWQKLQRYSHDWAIAKHNNGHKTTMWRAAAAGAVAFLRSYILRLGFLDGAMGLAVCTMQAQAAYGKYFELYFLNQRDKLQTKA